jgi:hypothetical protein
MTDITFISRGGWSHGILDYGSCDLFGPATWLNFLLAGSYQSSNSIYYRNYTSSTWAEGLAD